MTEAGMERSRVGHTILRLSPGSGKPVKTAKGDTVTRKRTHLKKKFSAVKDLGGGKGGTFGERKGGEGYDVGLLGSS